MEIPPKLLSNNLHISADKTEEYSISRKDCNGEWKSCKLLGSVDCTLKLISRDENRCISMP